jgi:hypothetical protein
VPKTLSVWWRTVYMMPSGSYSIATTVLLNGDPRAFIAELRHTLVVEVGLVHGRWRKSFTKVADKKLLSQKTMK